MLVNYFCIFVYEGTKLLQQINNVIKLFIYSGSKIYIYELLKSIFIVIQCKNKLTNNNKNK